MNLKALGITIGFMTVLLPVVTQGIDKGVLEAFRSGKAQEEYWKAAFKKGDFSVKTILPKSLSKKERPLLHWIVRNAAPENRLNIVNWFLINDANPIIKDKEEHSLLYRAIVEGAFDVVERLLDFYTDTSKVGDDLTNCIRKSTELKEAAAEKAAQEPQNKYLQDMLTLYTTIEKILKMPPGERRKMKTLSYLEKKVRASESNKEVGQK